MESKKKIIRFFILFSVLYLLVFLTLNLIEFWHGLKRKEKEEVKISEDVFQEEVKEINFSDKEDSLEIAKIGIEVPLILPQDLENNDFKKALDKGVVLHPESVPPGEKGDIFILGHSAPSGWPKINYDWVFSELNELEKGDEIRINFQKRYFLYYVTQKIFLEKGEEIPKSSEEKDSTLYLISCWPPGKDIRRIAVQALADY